MATFNMCGVNLLLSTVIAILAKGLAQSYQEAFVNDSVSMRCSPNGAIDIQWHHNSDLTYVYAGGRLRDPYDQRFLIKKYETTGEYDLIIPNVTLRDAGWYYCSGEISGIRISSTQLTVLYVSPACSSNVSPRGFVGPNTCGLQKENMTFSCDVKFNGRAPYVIWRSAYDSQTLCSSECEVKSNRSICNLTLRADPLYDGSVFICDAITPTGRRFSCNSEMIKVWYLSADSESSEKRIHDSTSCAVRSNLNVQYKWTLKQNGERIIFLSANQTIAFQRPGFHQCQVEYGIRNATCSTLVKNVTVDAEEKKQSALLLAITLPIIVLGLLVLFSILIICILRRRRRPTVIMDSPLTQKEILAIENNRETLLKHIDSDSLTDLLAKEGAIDKSQFQSICSKSSSRERNEVLLEFLKKGSLRLYWLTIRCLRQSNQIHVAEILETGGFSVECLPVDIDENEPFSRDVYIGFSPEDKETADALITQLRNNGINCYIPPLDFNRQLKSCIHLPPLGSDKHSSIKEGVNVSKKCLMLWPSKYLQEDWHEMERAAVLRKVEIFGRDTLIIVKSKSKQKVPKGLKGFNEIVVTKQQFSLDNENAIAILAKEIKRAPKGIMKFGLADGYFYGYLNIILKDFRKRLAGKDLTEPPVSAACLPNTLKKLLIIFPESCICPPSMVANGKIEFHKVVEFEVERAGKKRDYKNSLFKVEEGGEEYYFAGEFSASISTLYDTYKAKAESSEMTEEQLYEERNVFFYSLKTILNQPKKAAFKDQVKLVYWSDPKSKNTKRTDLHQCLVRVLKKELELERTLDYPMYNRPRGKCIIINTLYCEQGDTAMNEKRGPKKDTEILTKLFQDLHFEVSTDVDFKSLNEALSKMKESDHSAYDAFVCCIFAHGKHGEIYTNDGEIYTNDGKLMGILDIAENFSGIPSLEGKPKMFFIQASQPGENDAAQSESCPSASDFVTVQVEPERVRLLKTPVNSRSPTSVGDPRFLPEFPDFLMSYSCIPGEVVYRNDGSASYYVNALNECFRQGNEIDLALNEVTTKVRKELLEAREELRGVDLSKGLPFHRVSTKIRRIYL